jgi:hypothetical protein
LKNEIVLKNNEIEIMKLNKEKEIQFIINQNNINLRIFYQFSFPLFFILLLKLIFLF